MKQILTPFRILSALALLALAAGCANIESKENSLVAAGFKVVVPKNEAQQQKLKALPADKVTMVQKSGKTYYVFPNAAHNQAYVGGPKQYEAYRQLRMKQKLANEAAGELGVRDGIRSYKAQKTWALERPGLSDLSTLLKSEKRKLPHTTDSDDDRSDIGRPLALSRVLQLYYTTALLARAALLLAVRHPRLCLCGSTGFWRYAPLRCKTPENTIIVSHACRLI